MVSLILIIRLPFYWDAENIRVQTNGQIQSDFINYTFVDYDSRIDYGECNQFRILVFQKSSDLSNLIQRITTLTWFL